MSHVQSSGRQYDIGAHLERNRSRPLVGAYKIEKEAILSQNRQWETTSTFLLTWLSTETNKTYRLTDVPLLDLR